MLRRMKIGGRLNLLIMVPLLALIASAAVGYLALQRSSVRGDEYKALKMAQDLKADTAPPPANLLEAWANVNQVAVIASADGWTADSHAEIDEHMAVIEAARARFDSAMAYWAGQSLDPRVQARLVEIGGDIGDKFFADIDTRSSRPSARTLQPCCAADEWRFDAADLVDRADGGYRGRRRP